MNRAEIIEELARIISESVEPFAAARNVIEFLEDIGFDADISAIEAER